MEKEKIIIEEALHLNAPNTSDNSNKILKCPECFSIPIIRNEYDGDYSYKCRNNHKSKYLR